MRSELSVIIETLFPAADPAEVQDVPVCRTSDPVLPFLVQKDCIFILPDKLTVADLATIAGKRLRHRDHVSPKQLIITLIADHVTMLVFHVIQNLDQI